MPDPQDNWGAPPAPLTAQQNTQDNWASPPGGIAAPPADMSPRVTAPQEPGQPIFGLSQNVDTPFGSFNPTDIPIAGFFLNQNTYKTPSEQQVAQDYKPQQVQQIITNQGITVPSDTPVVGGLLQSIAEANSPTTPDMASAGFRDAPVVGGVSRVGEGILNLLNQSWKTIAEPAAGLASLPIRSLLDGTAGDSLARAEKRAGVTLSQGPGAWQEIGRAALAETPAAYKFIAPMVFDPITYVGGAFSGAQEAKLTAASTMDVVKIAKMSPLERIAQTGFLVSPVSRAAVDAVGEMGVLSKEALGMKPNRLLQNIIPWLYTDRARTYDLLENSISGLIAKSQFTDAAKTKDLLVAFSEAAKLNSFQPIADTFPDMVKAARSYEGQQLIRTMGELDAARMDAVLNSIPDAIKAIQTNALPEKAPDWMKSIFKAYQEGKIDATKGVEQVVNDAAKYKMLADATETMGKSAQQAFNLSADERLAVKVRDTVKSLEANLFIGFSPTTVINNFGNNTVTQALHGLNPFGLSKYADNMWKAWGMNPGAEFRRVQERALSTLARDTKSAGFAGLVKGRQFGPFLKLYSAVENGARMNIWAKGAESSFKEAMRLSADAMPDSVAMALRAVDPSGALLDTIKGAIRASYTPDQILNIVRGKLPVTLESNIGEIAKAMGVSESALMTFMHQSEVWPDINKALAESKNAAEFESKATAILNDLKGRVERARKLQDETAGKAVGDFVNTLKTPQDVIAAQRPVDLKSLVSHTKIWISADLFGHPVSPKTVEKWAAEGEAAFREKMIAYVNRARSEGSVVPDALTKRYQLQANAAFQGLENPDIPASTKVYYDRHLRAANDLIGILNDSKKGLNFDEIASGAIDPRLGKKTTYNPQGGMSAADYVKEFQQRPRSNVPTGPAAGAGIVPPNAPDISGVAPPGAAQGIPNAAGQGGAIGGIGNAAPPAATASAAEWKSWFQQYGDAQLQDYIQLAAKDPTFAARVAADPNLANAADGAKQLIAERAGSPTAGAVDLSKKIATPAAAPPALDPSKRIEEPGQASIPRTVEEAKKLARAIWGDQKVSEAQIRKDLRVQGWDTQANLDKSFEEFLKKYVEEPVQPMVRQLRDMGYDPAFSSYHAADNWQGVIYQDSQMAKTPKFGFWSYEDFAGGRPPDKPLYGWDSPELSALLNKSNPPNGRFFTTPEPPNAPLNPVIPVPKPEASPLGDAIKDLQDVTKEAPGATGMQADELVASRYKVVADVMEKLQPQLQKLYDTTGTMDGTSPQILAARQALEGWVRGDLTGAMTDARTVAARIGDWYVQRNILNYSARTNLDDWLSWVFPFSYWPRATATNYAMEALNRPVLITSYVRAKQALDQIQSDQGFPARFRGSIPVPMPFASLAPWLTGKMFYDPLKDALPIDRFTTDPIKNLGYLTPNTTDIANEIRSKMQSGEISDALGQAALKQQKGNATWDAVETQMKQAQQPDPLDISSLIFSSHFPLDWANKAMQGRPQDISYLIPLSRQIKGGDAILQALFPQLKGLANAVHGPEGAAGGFDPEGALRQKLGLPAGDSTVTYRVDRMLASMSVDGSVSPNAARLAMTERKGPVYDEAVKRAAIETGIGSMSGLFFFNSRVMAGGEQVAMNDAKQVSQLVDMLTQQAGLNPVTASYDEKKAALKATNGPDGKPLWSQISDWYSSHPEYKPRMELFDTAEARLSNWLNDSIWTQYLGMSALDRRMFSDQNPDFKSQFAAKPTRQPVSNIPNSTLEKWNVLLGGYNPQMATTQTNMSVSDQVNLALSRMQTKPTPYQLQDPKLAAAYQSWIAQLDKVQNTPEYQQYITKMSQFSAAQTAYYAPGANKKQVLAENPGLTEYWAWLRDFKANNPVVKDYFAFDTQFWKDNPDLAKLLGRSTTTSSGSSYVPYATMPKAPYVPRAYTPYTRKASTGPATISGPKLALMFDSFAASMEGSNPGLLSLIEAYLTLGEGDGQTLAQKNPALAAWLAANRGLIPNLRAGYQYRLAHQSNKYSTRKVGVKYLTKPKTVA